MLDARCWREVLIRAGITFIMVGLLYLWLGVSPWAWLAPPAIAGLVILKWALRPPEEDDVDGPYASDEPSGS